MSKPKYYSHEMSDLFVQLVGICVAEQLGKACDAQRVELGDIKTEINRRFDDWNAHLDRIECSDE